MELLSERDAIAIVGPMGFPSKMPGTAYGISAKACITGTKLAQVEGSVCHGCYALKANYMYPSVAQAHEKRLNGITDPRWTVAMISLLTHYHTRGVGRNGPFAKGWHRWHDSGDLQSVEHLTKICAVAAATPFLWHWLPTRELQIVKDYVARGGIVPDNLVIRVSATMVDGNATKAWPTTSGVHKDAAAQGEPCRAKMKDKKDPEYGKCGECRMCWDATVEHVSYPLH